MLDPEWAEAHMALGETFYHLLPQTTRPIDSLAQAAFSAAERFDSSFSPPLLHLAEIAFREGDAEERARVWSRFLSFDPDSTHLAHVSLMQRCVVSGLTYEGWAEYATTQPLAVFRAGYGLVVGGRQHTCAEQAFTALLARGQDPNLRWAAFFGLQGLLATQNRIDELQQLTDSAVAAGQLYAWYVYIIDALAGAHVEGHGMRAERFLKDLRGSEYEGIDDPTSLWLLGFWHAEVGDTELASLLQDQLSGMSDEYPAAAELARGLGGRLALLSADTTSALEGLQRSGSDAGVADIVWDFGASHPLERLWLARLLLAQSRYGDAIAVASIFDHQGPAVFFSFVAESLRIRHQAALALGDRNLASEFAARLTDLGRADLL